MKIRARTPILEPISGVSQEPCFQMKVRTKEQMKVRAKQAQATCCLFTLVIMQQHKGQAIISETPITSPLMKMLSQNWSSMRAGAQNQKMIVHCSKMHMSVISLSDLNLKRSMMLKVFLAVLLSPDNLAVQLYFNFETSWIVSQKSVILFMLAIK